LGFFTDLKKNLSHSLSYLSELAVVHTTGDTDNMEKKLHVVYPMLHKPII